MYKVKLFCVFAVLAFGSITVADELPLPDLIPHLSQFRLDACGSPQGAFNKFADNKTAVRLRELGSVLCPETDREKGWKIFFGTSVASVSSLSEKSVLSVFYSPYSDVALVCQWKNQNSLPVITDAELVCGDVLRGENIQTIPLWRRQQNVPPFLSLVVATSDTAKLFMQTYQDRPMWGAEDWRKRMSGIKKKDQLAENYKAVEVLYFNSLFSTDLFFNEAAFAPLKEQMGNIRQMLIDGKTAKVLAIAKDTTLDCQKILQEVTLDWTRATMVNLATDVKNAFVFVSDFSNPEYGACFWFKMTDDKGDALAKPALSRIDFVCHTLSFADVDALARQAGMKR